jgi:3-oxoacyl-[acyl-carrier protein] reductase
MGQLEGKVAIVTGAAVGIGRAIAIAYGREGAKVVVNYSKSKAEAEKTGEMLSQVGGTPLLIQADVSRDEQVRAMVDQTLERFGRIDILVNNAGITVRVDFPDLESLSGDIWDRLYNVNVKGTFFCCRAVVPPMRKQGSGRIINVASLAGLTTQGSSIAYSVSKAAVIHLSKCLARTLGPEIRVNAIAPGMIAETRWHEGWQNVDIGARLKKAAEATPLKQVGKPQDIAEVALFLATHGSFMTGAVLTVDGGRILA